MAGAEVLPPPGCERDSARLAPLVQVAREGDWLAAGVLEREARGATRIGDHDVVATGLEPSDRLPAPGEGRPATGRDGRGEPATVGQHRGADDVAL